MIYSLSGKLILISPPLAVIECQGVGYACKVSMQTIGKLGKVGEDTKLFTYLHVREDAVELYGFATTQEKDCFLNLITVSGVGPAMAIAILSDISPENVALCIATGDYKTLTRCKGVGTKIGQRIVLELKDKISKDIQTSEDISSEYIPTTSSNINEAISALAVLGYSKSEAAKALSKLPPDTSVEEMIKHGLKVLASNRG